LLRNPNPLDSGMEFMRDTVINYKLNGNSVWWLNRKSWRDKVDELWTIPFSQIQPIPDGRLYLSHYEYYPGHGKTPMRFETWEIFHLKAYNPNNKFVGLSPLESLVTTLLGDLGMRKTVTRTFTDYGGSPQSILAFKDFVNDEAWGKIKTEKQQAAQRNEMMMLRGVGDGVTWLSRAVSNKDADFVEILKRNMLDVFNRMCPGLVAMLDPNSTEATALAARATYAEKTLWPILETIAQKMTMDILPAYGLKLTGQFDDPRVVDRKIELDELVAYERTHTIGEVRTRQGDEPLGDERDDLFVSQINPQSGGVQEAPPSPFTQQRQNDMQGDMQDEVQEENEDTDDTGAEDVTTKAAIEDLAKWRKMALRGKIEKAKAFKSVVIPSLMMKDIAMKLESITDNDVIAALFDAKIESLKPKPKINPVLLIKSMEASIRALELKG